MGERERRRSIPRSRWRRRPGPAARGNSWGRRRRRGRRSRLGRICTSAVRSPPPTAQTPPPAPGPRTTDRPLQSIQSIHPINTPLLSGGNGVARIWFRGGAPISGGPTPYFSPQTPNHKGPPYMYFWLPLDFGGAGPPPPLATPLSGGYSISFPHPHPLGQKISPLPLCNGPKQLPPLPPKSATTCKIEIDSKNQTVDDWSIMRSRR